MGGGDANGTTEAATGFKRETKRKKRNCRLTWTKNYHKPKNKEKYDILEKPNLCKDETVNLVAILKIIISKYRQKRNKKIEKKKLSSIKTESSKIEQPNIG